MPRGHYQHKRKPPIERFWAKVAKGDPSECWPWQGSKVQNGYGQFWDGTRLITAHRFIFESLNGAVPRSYDVCHSCDNRACCNPAHLFAGTRSDNMRDCAAKGRTIGQKNPEKLKRGADHYSHAKPHLRVRGVRHGQSRLTEEEARFVLESKGHIPQRELACRFGVSQAAISMIHRGINWSHLS